MNFLEIPSCYDCIVKIKYGSTFSYLRMNLSNLRKVRSKFKNHLTCWILAFGNIYTWVQIEDAYLDTEYITCRKHTTNILGIRLFHPIDEKMPFVTLPKNFSKAMELIFSFGIQTFQSAQTDSLASLRPRARSLAAPFG